MGELYARVKLGVTQTPYVYGGSSVPYVYDSQGYSLADIEGEQYLVQALTSFEPAGWPYQGSVNGTTVTFAWGQFYPPEPVSYVLGLNATAVKTTSHLDSPPPVPNIGPLPNDIAQVNIYNEFSRSLYAAMGLTATYSGFMVISSDVDPASVIPGYLAPLQTVPFEFLVNSGFGSITFAAQASLPEYLWIDLGAHDPVLFDSGPDIVDFNNLSDDERAMISGGSSIYNGFGGTDIVTLPNRANYKADMGDGKTLGWTDTALSTFTTGSSAGQTYTIIAGDGDYFFKFGAGTDFLKISPAMDSSYVTEVIDGFSEKDIIDFVRRPGLTLDRPSGHERDWVNVYSGDVLVGVLKFTNSVTAGGLVPMDDGNGGTMIAFVGLFTEQADNVDFNHLSLEQQAKIASGVPKSNAMGGDDTVVLDVSVETFGGGAGNDKITGSSADDVINGESGDDQLTGGAGNDTLTGGSGNDTFIVDSGSDKITDLAGGDILKVAASSAVDATVTAAFTATASSSNSGRATLVTNGSFIDLSPMTATKNGFIVRNSSSGANIIGSMEDDVLEGGSDADKLWGGLGSDIIDGGSGDDFLYAGVDAVNFSDDQVANVLRGGAGQDTLVAWTTRGAQGVPSIRDQLDGGTDQDTYYVDSDDLIVKFESGEVAYLWGTKAVDQIFIYSAASGTRIKVFSGLGTDLQSQVAQLTTGNRILPRDIAITYDPLGSNSLKVAYDIDVGARVSELAQEIAIEVGRLAKLLGPVVDLIAGKIFGKIVEKSVGGIIDRFRSKLAAAAAEDYSGEVAIAVEKSVNEFGKFSQESLENMVYEAIKKQKTGDSVEDEGIDIPEWVDWAVLALSLVPGIGRIGGAAAESIIEIGTAAIQTIYTALIQDLDRELEAILERAPDTRHFIRPKAGVELPLQGENAVEDGVLGRKTYLVSHSEELENDAATSGKDVIYSALPSLWLREGVENGILMRGAAGDGIELNGNFLNNVLAGNARSNVLSGHDGDDELIGGAGDDTLFGGSGSDRLHGGEGRDRFEGTLDELNGDRIEDYEEGDEVVIEGAVFGQSAVSISSGSTIIRIDKDLDGVTDATITLDVDLAELLAARLVLAVTPGSDGGSTVLAFVHDDSPDPEERPRISVEALSASKNEGNSGTTSFTFAVSLDRASSADQTAEWAVSGSGLNPANVVDFGGTLLPSGTLTFAAGETVKTVTVSVVGDTVIEPDNDFTITLFNLSTDLLIGAASATGTILNDDAATVSVSAQSAVKPEGNAGAIASRFVISLSHASETTQIVSWTVSGVGPDPAGASDFVGGVLPAGTVTFLVGETSRIVTLNVAGDTALEADEDYTVSLSNPSSDLSIGTATASGTIVNDDVILNDDAVIAISASITVRAEGQGGTTAFTFTLTRSGGTSGAHSVAWAVAGDGATPAGASDFAGGVLPAGIVTFAVGETSKVVTVSVAGDTTVELDEGFTLTLSNPSGGLVIGTASAAGTIQNDDIPIPPAVTAHGDAYVVKQGQVLAPTQPLSTGLLVNDENAATASLLDGPDHGTLQLAGNGTFTYTPAAGFSGIDTFSYRASNTGATMDQAEVTIHVVPVSAGSQPTLDLVGLTAAEQIAATYAAFFGRGADAGGLDFWVGQFVSNLPTQGSAALFANIASSFGISSEAKALYPFLADPFRANDGQIAAFLNSVYDNLFNRTPDAGGLGYWTGQVKQTLQANQFVGSVLVNIMSGAQDSAAGQDIATLMGKVAVSLAYVREQQEHDTPWWRGPADIPAATALLEAVTADPAGVLVGVRNAEFLVASNPV